MPLSSKNSIFFVFTNIEQHLFFPIDNLFGLLFCDAVSSVEW